MLRFLFVPLLVLLSVFVGLLPASAQMQPAAQLAPVKTQATLIIASVFILLAVVYMSRATQHRWIGWLGQQVSPEMPAQRPA